MRKMRVRVLRKGLEIRRKQKEKEGKGSHREKGERKRIPVDCIDTW